VRYRAYQRYKSSRIEWLGDVPEHWQTPPLYTRYSVELGKMLNEGRITGTYLLRYLRNIDIQWDKIDSSDLPEMDIAPSERERFTIKTNDLLVCEGGEVGRAAIVSKAAEGLGYQKALHRMRPLNSDELPRYMFYTLYAASQRGVFLAEGNPNTIPHLTGENLRRYRLPRPPAPEQIAIANFLDHEAVKIDLLVAKKRELIERLKEKRTTLISRAVTRGLPAEAARAEGVDPHPKLKPSGVEWIGEVPAHWTLCKLSRVTISRCDGPFGSGLKSEHYSDEGVRVIRLQNIRFASFDDTDQVFIEPEYYRDLGDHTVLPSDILIAGLGDENNPVGRACVAPRTLGPAMVKADCFRFRLDTGRAHPPYLALHLSATALTLAGALSTGTTRGRMNLSATADRIVALPPVPEQRHISSYLEQETARIGQMEARVEQAIQHLLEFRTAMITAAVTGKIDVRGQTRDNTRQPASIS